MKKTEPVTIYKLIVVGIYFFIQGTVMSERQTFSQDTLKTNIILFLLIRLELSILQEQSIYIINLLD